MALITVKGSVWNSADNHLALNVKDFGAIGDGVADDTAALQAAYDLAGDAASQPLGGASVHHPKGTYRTSGKLEILSDVVLTGDGLTNTYIKPLDSATFAANEAVIQSKDFETVQGTNLWDYYSPYPNGLIMGFGIRDITIDGNRANVANAGGLNIYGGKWNFQSIGVANTAGHCIWTEAGIPISSTSGDDFHDFLNMHESFADNIYIVNANKHGWFYRGPNDSSVNNVQIKTCLWGGFFQESTGNNSVGNLEIGSIHAYSCECQHDAAGGIITLANSNANFLYVDASFKNGVIFNTAASIVDMILVLGNNQNNAGSFWGVICNVATQIGIVRNSEKERTSGVDGGLVQVNAASTVIDQIRTVQSAATSIAQVGVEINAACNIGKVVVEAYDSAGSVGVIVDSGQVNVGVAAKTCVTAVDYQTSGRNSLTLNADTCTTDVLNTVAFAASDVVEVITTQDQLTNYTSGRALTRLNNINIRDLAYAASFNTDVGGGGYIKIGALTGAITINNPTNAVKGDELRYQMQQDGVGSHAVTFDTDFKTSYSDTGNAAFTRHIITFMHDGTFFVEQSKSGWL